jgi:hypothetical protein
MVRLAFLPLCAILSLVQPCNGSTPQPAAEVPVRMIADFPVYRDKCINEMHGRIGTKEDFCSVQAPDYSNSHWGCEENAPPMLICMVPAFDAGAGGLPTD